MIDKCDVLLTFYDEYYKPPKRDSRSGTGIAVKYAKRKHKRIVNIYELLLEEINSQFNPDDLDLK